MTLSEQLAEAYVLIARCNHYLVGHVPSVLINEEHWQEARQNLIRRENEATGRTKRILTLALDLLEHDAKARNIYF